MDGKEECEGRGGGQVGDRSGATRSKEGRE